MGEIIVNFEIATWCKIKMQFEKHKIKDCLSMYAYVLLKEEYLKCDVICI